MSQGPHAAGVASATVAKAGRDHILACACAAWAVLCYATFFLVLPRLPHPVGESVGWAVLVMLSAPLVAMFGLTVSVLGLWFKHGNRRLLLIALVVNLAAAMPILVSGFQYQLSRFS